MNYSYSYMDTIKSRMSAEDVKFYSEIWAPVEVAVPDEDSGSMLTVMPDGELRCYGVWGKQSVFDHSAPRCYLSSVDGGLSWKRHMVKGRFDLGASTYVSYLNKYISVQNAGEEGSFLLVGNTPDDINPMRILISAESCGEIRMIFPMRSRNRVIIVGHEQRPELHPTAYFAVLYYADGDLRDWTRVPLPAVPFHVPQPPHKGVRWQQNNRENTIEEISGGRLMMISRTATDYHYISYSDDGGETWSEAVPSTFHSTGTMPALKRLSDGKLLFCWCNTRPLAELDSADGIWEDVFTNRDALHIAISNDDGKSWKGFRELALNPHRNAADFRSLGGPEVGRDKSVHQVEILEMPYNKLLISYGQHTVCRRLILVDRGWITEKTRREDFIHGLGALSTHTYVKSVLGCYRGTEQDPLSTVGHCAYNRVPSALLLPDPYREGREALQICRNEDPRLVSPIGGAVWNFPASDKGTVKLLFRVEGEGMRVSLLDHWVNPTDDEVRQIADFSGIVTTALQQSANKYTELSLQFDCESNTVAVYADGRFLSQTTMKGKHPNGLSYLHLQSAATSEDLRGTLVAGLEFIGE